mmetsp:Transcript_65229/g.76623  ORF Transcript_65229/g.76623 Transcript_65229/m.76623 type:complete len:129 (+) Transcript_65229:172-558(+)
MTPRPSRQCYIPVGFRLHCNSPPSLRKEQDKEGNVQHSSCSTTTITDVRATNVDVSSLRVRGRDMHKINPLIDSKTSPAVTTDADTATKPCNTNTGKRIQLDGVYFPSLAMLLPRWESSIRRRRCRPK